MQFLGIIICLMHSALFSGLNLGFFGLSRLRLEIQAEAGHEGAKKILDLRRDAHFLLATVLWGNVGANVLLTMLSDSIFMGTAAFLISTFMITFFGEIFPQAYFAKHALRASFILVPIVKFYQVVLYPIARPTALLLDHWLGREQIIYFKENEIRIMLERQAKSGQSDVEALESLGAVNFLALDDVRIEEEGEVINPASIISLPSEGDRPIFPAFTKSPMDHFLQDLNSSEEKWVIITDTAHEPCMVLDADHFLRESTLGKEIPNIYSFCHRPIVVKNSKTKFAEVMHQFKVNAEHSEDDVIDHDIILYWGQEKRIITGADILGRLLRGIAKRS